MYMYNTTNANTNLWYKAVHGASMLFKYEVSMEEFGCMSVRRKVLLSREEVVTTEILDALLLKLRKK